jgi:hypothetical protein
MIDVADYNLWRGRFGAPADDTALLADVVPEPTSVSVLFLALLFALFPRQYVYSPTV